MHAVRGEIFRLHREERAGTDVQRDPGELHAPRADRIEQRRVEVQSGRRGGDGSGTSRVHGLVPRLVGRRCGARDVGWQRDGGVPREIVDKRSDAREAQAEEPIAARDDVGVDGSRQANRLARTRCMAGADLEQALGRAQNPFEQQFDPAATRLHAHEPGFHDLCVVQHQEVAVPQEQGQLAKPPVRQYFAGNVQQAAVGTLGGRELRDPIRRKHEVEIGKRVATVRHGVQL